MKIKQFFFIISTSIFMSNSFSQNNSEIELLLINHDWTLVDKYHIDQNKDILSSYKMVFTNSKGFWRPGYRVHLKNNGELIAGSFPLCGTGPQIWSSLKGHWEILKDNSIVFHYTENEIHYMNMEPLQENKEVEFKPRKEVYELTIINDQYIGLNLIKDC